MIEHVYEARVVAKPLGRGLPLRAGGEQSEGVDEMVRRVALRQQMQMSAAELIRWADDLRAAPPVPPRWRGTMLETSLAEQADLADSLAPLRVELDDQQWAELRRHLDRGQEVDAAAQAVRDAST